MTSRRDALRRRLQVVRHAEPAEALVAMTEPPSAEFPAVRWVPDPLTGQPLQAGHVPTPEEALAEQDALDWPVADVSRETVGGPYVAGGPVFDVAALQEPPPSLSRAQVLRLEALTAVWERQVRQDGPARPDATMFLSVPALPPVPPARRRTDPPAQLEESPPVAKTTQPAAAPAVTPPARVSDWSSRHDPRSLEFAVRDRLTHPVPVQDFLLERGPVLDQGTTPPLSLHDASACVGMAAVAAANVLDVESRPVYARPDPDTLLGVEDARRVYARAQELDQISGENYAGTSVLAGMKAGREAGWWDTYLWGLGGTRDVAQALLQLRSPVVVGIPWGPSLDEPDAAGIIAPAGPLEAGHALCVVGIRVTLTARQRSVAHQVLAGPYFVLQQSRGTAEGDGGLVYLHHTHLAQLLRGVGEAAVPVSRWAST